MFRLIFQKADIAPYNPRVTKSNEGIDTLCIDGKTLMTLISLQINLIPTLNVLPSP